MVGGQVGKTTEANKKTHLTADGISPENKAHDEGKSDSWLQIIGAKLDQFLSDADDWGKKWGPYAFTGLGFGIAAAGLIRELFKPKTIQQGFMQPAEATAGSGSPSIDLDVVRSEISRDPVSNYPKRMREALDNLPRKVKDAMRQGILHSQMHNSADSIEAGLVAAAKGEAPAPTGEADVWRTSSGMLVFGPGQPDPISMQESDPSARRINGLIEGALNGEGDLLEPQRSTPELDWFTDEPVDLDAEKELAREARKKYKASEYRRMVLIENNKGEFKAVPLKEIHYWQFRYSKTFETLDKKMKQQIMTDKDTVIEVLEDAMADPDFRKNFMVDDRITEKGYVIILGDYRIAPRLPQQPKPANRASKDKPILSAFEPKPCIIANTPEEGEAMRAEAQALYRSTFDASSEAAKDNGTPRVSTPPESLARTEARHQEHTRDRAARTSLPEGKFSDAARRARGRTRGK